MLHGIESDIGLRHCKSRHCQVAHLALREVENSGNNKVADCRHCVENTETRGSRISYA